MGVTISVVCPTIAGREVHYRRALAAYEATTELELEWIPIVGARTCGEAWNEGVERATGDYVHLTADDLEPAPGWYHPAIHTLELGAHPAPRVENPDGSLQSCGDGFELPEGSPTAFSRIPFLTVDLARRIFPIPEWHYYTDNVVSDRARRFGVPAVVARAYAFRHYNAQEGRLDERFAADGAAYAELEA